MEPEEPESELTENPCTHLDVQSRAGVTTWCDFVRVGEQPRGEFVHDGLPLLGVVLEHGLSQACVCTQRDMPSVRTSLLAAPDSAVWSE